MSFPQNPPIQAPYLYLSCIVATANFAAGVDSGRSVILCNGAITVTLPLAASNFGRSFIVKKIDAGAAVTIAASGADTIDGAATQTLPDQYDVMQVVSDGLAWYVVSFSNL